jgi:hypothetical protein
MRWLPQFFRRRQRRAAVFPAVPSARDFAHKFFHSIRRTGYKPPGMKLRNRLVIALCLVGIVLGTTTYVGFELL